MSVLPEKGAIRSYPFRTRVISWILVWFIRILSLTLRWRLHDPAGISRHPPDRPMIWAIWHNRILAFAHIYLRYLPMRQGAILTSASRDGEIIAAMVTRFRGGVIRGSSSRKGASALLGLLDWVRGGYDVAIVPDGPRGPRYRFGPGIVKLAEVTGALVLPLRVEFGSYWHFKSWDRFRVPKPFSTVDIHLGPCTEVPSGLDPEAFEAERLRLETLLNPAHETD